MTSQNLYAQHFYDLYWKMKQWKTKSLNKTPGIQQEEKKKKQNKEKKGKECGGGSNRAADSQ